jgi:hypothetical protein
MKREARIRRGQSCATDAREAARAFHREVAQDDMALVVFFCSSRYDLHALAYELRRLFAGTQVVGCTTGGEIGPMGCRDASISGASFPSGGFAATIGRVDRLRQFEFARGDAVAQDLLQRLESLEPAAAVHNSFALMLIDGLSVREEAVTRAVQSGLGAIPLVGGSAGDGESFGRTYVYADGEFRTDTAVLALFTTPVPFRTFKTQHFVPTDQRAVVTAADSERRRVIEIDGWPAVEQFARLVGATVDGLDSSRFAAHPMVVLIDGANYVRAIQTANADGSLTLFCAIEEGVVLRVARGVNLVEDLKRMFADLRAQIGEPELVIGCDCVLRKLEMVQRGFGGDVETVFRQNQVTGFNSYGEQYGGVHVNQTFTGIAIAQAGQ